jgi:hypothetical protein
MQLNPENDRYWSSRGYDDDDCDDEVSSFNQKSWEEKTELENQERKDFIDSISINILDKKVIFLHVPLHGNAFFNPAAAHDKYLFESVLKERVSVKKFGSADARQRGLTVKFKSFKDFLGKHLDYDVLEEQEKRLTERVKEIEESHVYKCCSWAAEYDTLKKEFIKLNKIKQCLSLKLIKRILDEEHFISNAVKRNYIYFNDVYISDSYMIFKINPKDQGSMIGSIWDNNYRWLFAVGSAEIYGPEVLYNNFEDVFTCKKYLIDL